MHNSKHDQLHGSNASTVASLKAMTRQQFADYRMSDLVYVRTLNRQQLFTLIPDIEAAPQADLFWVLVAANGQPVMVTDQYDALDDWLSEHDADMAVIN